jgi:hypothetical protein
MRSFVIFIATNHVTVSNRGMVCTFQFETVYRLLKFAALSFIIWVLKEQ